MENNLHTRQLAILVFIMGFTYKVSKLPSLFAKDFGSEGVFLAFLFLILELVHFLIIYRFIATRGLDTIKDTVWFKGLALLTVPVFFIKMALMTSGTVYFTETSMFESISKYEIIIPLMVVIAYLAIKGMRSIARVSEIMIFLIITVLIINLLFLKVNMDFSKNLPIVTDFSKILTEGNRYLFWFGDSTPFLFITLSSGKKRSLRISLLFTGCMVLLAFLLLNALYGNAGQYVGNLIIKVASFNQFADKLGRLDWSGMIVWEIMSIVYLSVYMWGMAEAISYVFKYKKVVILVLASAIAIFEIKVKNTDKMIEIATGNLRWICVAVNYLIPFIMLVLSVILKKIKVKRGEVIEQNA